MQPLFYACAESSMPVTICRHNTSTVPVRLLDVFAADQSDYPQSSLPEPRVVRCRNGESAQLGPVSSWHDLTLLGMIEIIVMWIMSFLSFLRRNPESFPTSQVDALRLVCPDWSKLSDRATAAARVLLTCKIGGAVRLSSSSNPLRNVSCLTHQLAGSNHYR